MPARATSPANSEWGQKPDAPLARLVSDPNRSRLNSVVTRLLTGLCCLAVAANAAAQPPGESAAGPGGWRSLRVPGGVAPLLKAAGLDESLPRTRALRDVIHVLYDTQPGVNDAFDARRRNVITYLESISAVEALGLEEAAAAPSLRQAEDRAVRKRIETIAEAIGCTLERESRTYRLQADQGERQTRRRADLASAGLDVDALVKAANAGQPIAIALRADEVPQPLLRRRVDVDREGPGEALRLPGNRHPWRSRGVAAVLRPSRHRRRHPRVLRAKHRTSPGHRRVGSCRRLCRLRRGHPRGGRARERAWRAGGRAALAGSRGRIRGPSRSLHPETSRQGWRKAGVARRCGASTRQPAPGLRPRLVDPQP